MEWISVKDRLPEEGDAVLVFARDCIMGEARFNKDGFYWNDFFGSPDFSEVTHWIRWPETPKD